METLAALGLDGADDDEELDDVRAVWAGRYVDYVRGAVTPPSGTPPVPPAPGGAPPSAVPCGGPSGRS